MVQIVMTIEAGNRDGIASLSEAVGSFRLAWKELEIASRAGK